MGKRSWLLLIGLLFIGVFNASAESLDISGFDHGDWNNVALVEDDQDSMQLALFADNFADGTLDTPGLSPILGTWRVDNGELHATGITTWAAQVVGGEETWKEYAVQFKIKAAVTTWCGLIFRYNTNPDRYIRVEFNFGNSRYRVFDNKNNAYLAQSNTTAPIVTGKWYYLSFLLKGNEIQFQLRDEEGTVLNPITSVNVPSEYLSGKIGLTTTAQPVAFDDFIVSGKEEGAPTVANTGIFTSQVIDLGENQSLAKIDWTGEQPFGTRLILKIRAAEAPFTMADTALQWTEVSNGQEVQLPKGRYVQYQAILQANPQRTLSPALESVTVERGTLASYQGTVSGEDGPLENAIVELCDGEGALVCRTDTDQDGKYAIEALFRQGFSYHLQVTAPGYKGLDNVVAPTESVNQLDLYLATVDVMAPESVIADPDSKPGIVEVRWIFSGDAIGFRIYRKHAGEFLFIQNVEASEEKVYLDYLVSPDQQYVYGVSAVLADNEESPLAWSDAVIARKGEGVARGMIRDNHGNPIAGATVKIGDKQTITNTAGEYVIARLVIGDYQLSVSKRGFEGENRSITILAQQETVTDVEMIFLIVDTDGKLSYLDVFPQFINDSSQRQVNFSFSLDVDSSVTLAIYSLDGFLLKTLSKDELFYAKTPYLKVWDLQDRYGRRVSVGLYLALFHVKPVSALNDYKIIKRIVVFK